MVFLLLFFSGLWIQLIVLNTFSFFFPPLPPRNKTCGPHHQQHHYQPVAYSYLFFEVVFLVVSFLHEDDAVAMRDFGSDPGLERSKALFLWQKVVKGGISCQVTRKTQLFFRPTKTSHHAKDLIFGVSPEYKSYLLGKIIT